MAGRWFVAGAIAVGATIAFACGSDSGDDNGQRANMPDAGPNPASDGGSQADTAVPCPLPDAMRGEVRGRVTILDGTRPPPPASHARVCIHERPELPCVETSDDGMYEHTCVPTGNVGIVFTHDVGRMLWLRVLSAGLPQLLDTSIATREDNVRLFAPVGVPYPQPGMGILTVNDSLDSANGGLTVIPPEGSIGPFYSTDGEKITHDAGPSTGGGVVFVLMKAGQSRIDLVGANGGCMQVSGGWDSRDGGITVNVLDDGETRVFVACP